jgi:hypothetical protein
VLFIGSISRCEFDAAYRMLAGGRRGHELVLSDFREQMFYRPVNEIIEVCD